MSLLQLKSFLENQLHPVFTTKPQKQACVYYLCSHANFLLIQESGYIMPRNAVEHLSTNGDLSCNGIQNRRKRDLYLGNGVKTFPPRPPHNCLNFFLNPNNDTFQAFLRNSYIANEGYPDLLILEFPLEAISNFLAKFEYLYACSNKNLAAGGFCSSLNIQYENFDWEKIMSADLGLKECSAEFFLWIQPTSDLNNPSVSGPEVLSENLPLKLASNVYHHSDTSSAKLNLIHFTQASYLHSKGVNELFTYDYRWLTYLSSTAGLKIDNLLLHFYKLLEKMPFSLSAIHFQNSENAISYIHGFPHVSKVMFWIAFLTPPDILPLITSDNLDENLQTDSMLAALIHDLRRIDDSEDENHGQEASNFFKDIIFSHTNGDLTRSLMIEKAVSDHCRPDIKAGNRNNLVWKILKDADAIDRGRFAPPCDAIDFKGTLCQNEQCSHIGCSYNTLRLDYAALGGANSLAWAAWNLACSTKNASWTQDLPLNYLIHHIKTCAKIVNTKY